MIIKQASIQGTKVQLKFKLGHFFELKPSKNTKFHP